MDNVVNLGAVVESKGGKGLGKSAALGAAQRALLPITFEQLLDDSATQLSGEAAGLTATPQAADPGDQAILEVTLNADAASAAHPAAGNEAGSNAMLQMWQDWLPRAPADAGAAQPTEMPEEAAVELLKGEGPRREMGSALELRPAPQQLALEPAGTISEEQVEFALPSTANAALTAAARETDASASEALASSNETQAPLATAQAEPRKLGSQPLHSAHIAAPLRSAEWSNNFAEQVVLLVREGDQRAELRLNPAELGPIDVTVSMQDDRVRANFVIHHAATADAVQAALPRLEQMMAERGVQLDGVSVEMGERRQEQAGQQPDKPGNSGTRSQGGGEPGRDSGEPVGRVVRRMGLVDTFA